MNENIVVTKKGCTFWKVVKVLLIVGAVCFAAVKVYQKFFKKNEQAKVDAPDETPETEKVSDGQEAEAFEVPADAVIAGAAELDAGKDAQ